MDPDVIALFHETRTRRNPRPTPNGKRQPPFVTKSNRCFAGSTAPAVYRTAPSCAPNLRPPAVVSRPSIHADPGSRRMGTQRE